MRDAARADQMLPLHVDAQPTPLPRHLGPMQPRLAAAPFNSADHIFEVKWDGIRALVAKDEHGVRIVDRHGGDLLARLPELASVERQLPNGTLLDAEVVCCDAKGRPRYALLAERLGRSRRRRGHGPIVLAFDLLYDAYRPVLGRPLIERRERLAQLPIGPGGRLLVPEHLEFDGEPFFDAVGEFGLEGIVAKRRDSAYVPGARTAEWLKVHTTPRIDAVVCGAVFTEGLPRTLLCGAYRGDALQYVGWAYVPPFLRAHVAERLAGLERADSPIEGPVEMTGGLRWLRPEACAIVEHAGGDRMLSADARFRAFRLDLDPQDCRLEEVVRMPSQTPRLGSDRPRLVVMRSLFHPDTALR